jgi:hypothetical protein
MVDHQDFDHALLRYQFDPELRLHGFQERGACSHGRRVRWQVKWRAGARRLNRLLHRYFKLSRRNDLRNGLLNQPEEKTTSAE